MKKDVIYIDIEDDITAVIDKIKNSSEKIVALVPPKGNAVLQSVVNLKLLQRAAGNVSKQPVIVTNNQALTALVGGLGLYVAKNLQSKPVLASAVANDMPEEEAVEVSDDIGELSSSETASPTSAAAGDESEVELSSDELASLEESDKPTAGAKDKTAKKSKGKKEKGKKVPNFDSFRKKLLIGGAILLLVAIGLLAIFGRAKAGIVIRAETTPVDVAFDATLNANSKESDPKNYTLAAEVQENKKTVSQSFDATGEKDVGSKASGTMTISNCQTPSSFSVKSGTKFTSDGLTFVSTRAVSVPGAQGNFISGCTKAGTASVPVTASANGDNYNLSPREYSNSLGEQVESEGSQMSGGTSKIVKVITQGDVDRARAQLNQQDTSKIKSDLKDQFDDNIKVFDDSFTASLANIRSEPAVGQEANQGKLTAEATYTMLGVSKETLAAAVDAFVATKMTNKDQQRVYETGLDDATFKKVKGDARTATYNITTIAQYGPQFDTTALKEEVAGKKFGAAKSYLQDLPGVKGVDINLSPFWARTLPGIERIDIKLEVDETTSG